MTFKPDVVIIEQAQWDLTKYLINNKVNNERFTLVAEWDDGVAAFVDGKYADRATRNNDTKIKRYVFTEMVTRDVLLDMKGGIFYESNAEVDEFRFCKFEYPTDGNLIDANIYNYTVNTVLEYDDGSSEQPLRIVGHFTYTRTAHCVLQKT